VSALGGRQSTLVTAASNLRICVVIRGPTMSAYSFWVAILIWMLILLPLYLVWPF
jgi:hypothetical protein